MPVNGGFLVRFIGDGDGGVLALSTKPPERPVLERRAYAEAYRRTNRLLI